MNGKATMDDSGGSTVEGKPPKTPGPPKVGLFELFKFSTPLDTFLIISGVCLGKSVSACLQLQVGKGSAPFRFSNILDEKKIKFIRSIFKVIKIVFFPQLIGEYDLLQVSGY